MHNCHYRQFLADNKVLPEFQAGSYYEIIYGEVKNIDDEIDFELPDGWSWSRINDFCTIIFSGKSPKYSKEQTKHKVIGQQANQWDGVNLQYVKYCTNVG